MDSVIFYITEKIYYCHEHVWQNRQGNAKPYSRRMALLSPHACPCSIPNKSHVIHSLRPCRNSPLSKTKLNSHTPFWDYIWFERYLHVCKHSHYNSLNAVTTTSIMKWEAVHLTKSATQPHIPQNVSDWGGNHIFSYTFIIHIPSSHLSHLL
jgi:hypothetical protein